MILKNINESIYITVKDINKKNIQVKPGKTIVVSDKVGTGLLNNYHHIFKKLETAEDKESSTKAQLAKTQGLLLETNKAVEALQKEIAALKGEKVEAKEVDEELVKIQEAWLVAHPERKAVPPNKRTDKERLVAKTKEAVEADAKKK